MYYQKKKPNTITHIVVIMPIFMVKCDYGDICGGTGGGQISRGGRAQDKHTLSANSSVFWKMDATERWGTGRCLGTTSTAPNHRDNALLILVVSDHWAVAMSEVNKLCQKCSITQGGDRRVCQKNYGQVWFNCEMNPVEKLLFGSPFTALDWARIFHSDSDFTKTS